jgi:hypothetical protein
MIGGRWSGRDTRRYTSSSGPGPNSHRHARVGFMPPMASFSRPTVDAYKLGCNASATRRARPPSVPPPPHPGDSGILSRLTRFDDGTNRLLESVAARLSTTCAWCELAGDHEMTNQRRLRSLQMIPRRHRSEGSR